MKKLLITAALCSAALLVGCNKTVDREQSTSSDQNRSPIVPSSATTSSQEIDENTLLTVNGKPVTKTMYGLYFQDRMRSMPNAQNNQQMQMTILNELANVFIVAQAAEKQDIDKRPEISAALELLKAKLMTQTLIQEYASKNKPTDAEVQSHYDAEYANKVSTEYKARHILVKEEDEAKSLITQLGEGGDFAELAKAHSTGPTGKNGGDLGWFDKNQMVAPFSEAVQAMELNSHTKEPVKTQFGWHVILLEDKRETPAPSLESVKAEINAKLQQQSLADYMQELREKSELKFNEKAGLKKIEKENP
jgi:peptidyl-prolyl cis-trans isomerase C